MTWLFVSQLVISGVTAILSFYLTLLSVAFDIILVLNAFAPFTPAVDFSGVTFTLLRSAHNEA